MPLYEYQCRTCGVRFERLQRKSEPVLEQCPECAGSVRRLIQPPGIIFKGSGFYVTDNRSSRAGSRRSSTKKETSTDKKEKDSSH